MQVTELISNFSRITFPHYVKVTDNTNSIEAGIVFKTLLNEGDLVSIKPLKLNTRVFKVSKVWGVRIAKGNWTFLPAADHPKFCTIVGELIGFYDPSSREVSPTFIN